MDEFDFVAFFILFCIFAMPFIIAGLAAILSHRQKMKELETKFNESEKIKIQEENKSIKHRLEVLEAIVTEKKYDLNEKIARLK